MNMLEVMRYIRAIRNDEKRRYAEAYLEYVLKQGANPSNDDTYELGAMAKQAVRMNIDTLHS